MFYEAGMLGNIGEHVKGTLESFFGKQQRIVDVWRI
jgi:hypothetical protein